MVNSHYTPKNALEFIEFLTSFAPEGETVLIVEQIFKPDGSQTWLPRLPNRYRGGNKAWYANTGSFIIDRFVDGKPSASSSNCTHVVCMVLDDIGTKSKEPPLAPTWIIETSEGNYQWGYVFATETAPTTQEFSAAIKAIANAGYTDGGAINPVRNFRVPDSVNLKEGKNNFVSRLVAFNRVEFTLEQICTALDVDPDEPDTVTLSHISIADDGEDDVLQWLSDKQLVVGKDNGSGWYSVVCPNYEAHTQGVIARYHPVHRSFKCFHEHCTHLDSTFFLTWAHNEGAPQRAAGVRDDLLAKRFAEVMQKIEPNDKFEFPQILIQQVQQRQKNRMDKREWFSRYAYMENSNGFYDMERGIFVPRNSFNALYAHLNCRSIHNIKSPVAASVCFDQNRDSHNAVIASEFTYAAGDETVLVDALGVIRVNKWRNGRPQVAPNPNADVRLWLELMERLIPNKPEREHVLNVMAFKLQNPKIKINHAILHMGTEGCGKDTLWAPFIWSVCGKDKINLGMMNCDSMLSQFTYALESEILVLNELKEPDIMGRRALANKMKEWIAAPPDMLEINRKGEHRYFVANRLFVLAFSNEETPISISSKDRRWYPIESRIAPLAEDKASAIWHWYLNGGFEAIASYLWARDVSKFNPSARTEMTQTKENLIENSRSETEENLLDMIRKREGVFEKGVLSTPLGPVMDILRHTLPRTAQFLHKNAVLSALHEAGWVNVPKCHSVRNLSLKNIFCAPELKNCSKSELADLLAENSFTPVTHQSIVKLVK